MLPFDDVIMLYTSLSNSTVWERSYGGPVNRWINSLKHTQTLWDVITCPCPRYILLTQSSYMRSQCSICHYGSTVDSALYIGKYNFRLYYIHTAFKNSQGKLTESLQGYHTIIWKCRTLQKKPWSLGTLPSLVVSWHNSVSRDQCPGYPLSLISRGRINRWDVP